MSAASTLLTQTLATPLPENASKGTPPSYDRVQRTFHLVMDAIILTAMLIGLHCSYRAPGTPLRKWLLDYHKSLGLIALALIGFRIAYRLTIGTPPYAERMNRINHAAAYGAHLALYALMLFMPLTGYLTSGAGGRSMPWFGLFQLLRLVPLDKVLEQTEGRSTTTVPA
ncbi:cytochrome b/b6 domain-containing protein [Lichenihabitans sp. Uapishka_5]|uniref:cytochrome b n=1 Tax=Lichenihabitans sp. Uapishka_5 TaxID=3037302 RepID=UPI0029E7EBB3|nr:cytochrome b/b6 domain-containing protein [Lichenihabitans sp. Uapishka_5]MDX7951467.1 cytochrome b/b6 domain-containing protein [Lichenihabitans sp. Uapishka_5]